MDLSRSLALEGVESLPLHTFTQQAYLDYAMYVILDRALPHIGDGLKPVQRRVVYAMNELGLSSSSKHKKSARTVGDVLGKYHPHSEVACYEAMVLMAQSFSYRYPLIDGQGNFGSLDDPKSFAAMRYTEARLSDFSRLLLNEVDEGTVHWSPNFDGTLKEPDLLPAEVPNVLLNGSMGIAVGMATDIPPHNLTEIIDGCLHLLKSPHASLDTIMRYIKGPDYPTEAEIITSPEAIRSIYETGGGSLRMRAVYHEEEGEIVITSLPYQVSSSKIIIQIAAQLQAKKLPLVVDCRDESDHENPVRIVIVPRSNRVDVEATMSHLFATTELERTYRVNMNVIGLDGRPQVKPLIPLLNEWITFRTNTVRKRVECRLGKVRDRLHILDGLMISYLNLDEVIHIIRTEDEPKQVLMSRFGLTEIQANAILDLKLRHLAKLEEFKIKSEQDELNKERMSLENILSSEESVRSEVADELKVIRKKYGDVRRSPIMVRSDAQALSVTETIPVESVTVVLSQLGWVRCAKGTDIDGTQLSYKAQDGFLCSASGKSNQHAIFLDSKGRSYSQLAHQLPSARGQGEPLTGRFQPEPGAQFGHVMMGSPEQKVLLGSVFGFGFMTTLDQMISKNRAGKALISVQGSGGVLKPLAIDPGPGDRIVLTTKMGRIIVIDLYEAPVLSKGKGNMLIKIQKSDYEAGHDGVKHWIVVKPGQDVLLHSGRQYLRLDHEMLKQYMSPRGRKGAMLPKGYRSIAQLSIEDHSKAAGAPA